MTITRMRLFETGAPERKSPAARPGHDLLFSALSAAALAQPIDEPSDHERGQQERDDHAYADKHIGENDSGAVLDGHGARTEVCIDASVRSVERIASLVHSDRIGALSLSRSAEESR
jgi:hypothetical protein